MGGNLRKKNMDSPWTGEEEGETLFLHEQELRCGWEEHRARSWWWVGRAACHVARSGGAGRGWWQSSPWPNHHPASPACKYYSSWKNEQEHSRKHPCLRQELQRAELGAVTLAAPSVIAAVTNPPACRQLSALTICIPLLLGFGNYTGCKNQTPILALLHSVAFWLW